MKIKNRLFSLYMKVNYIVAAAMMMVVVSCTEQIDVETSAEAGLQIKVVNDGMFDSEKGGTRATYSGLTTTFENGDSIGIYAVQGTTVKHANVKATLNNGTWFLHDFVKYKDNYTYYAYFPYQKTPSTPDFTQSTLDTKFGGMINGWSVADDQSTTAKFKANDLMLAQGSNTSDNVITFQMTHKMALAVLQAGESCTMSYSSAPNEKTPLIFSFSNKFPLYNDSNNKYYYIMKANTLTSLGGVNIRAGSGKYIERSLGDINENYTLTYSTDNGSTYTDSKPDWLVSINETRNPGEPLNFCINAVAPESYKGLTELSSVIIDEAKNILSQRTPVSNYDLSTHDIYGNSCAMTTANCYMIHAPGTYKLPLVYGNAIKNGTTNTSAYNSGYTGTSTLIRVNYNNHADNPITGPWLKDHAGAIPASAELIWQDVQGLISQVGINGDYLTFTIPAESITSGNALIAVKNSSGTIVWSWHIWVTDQDWNDKITRLSEGVADMYISPSELGCAGDNYWRETRYKGNKCMVKLLTDGGAQAVFEVEQPNYVIRNKYIDNLHFTYYEHGRKDPFAPVRSTRLNASSSPQCDNVTVYDINGNDVTSQSSPTIIKNSAVSEGTAISNPTQIYSSSSNNDGKYTWFSKTYFNDWDSDLFTYITSKSINNITGKNTTKTVYDPCPPGFCVPNGDFAKLLKKYLSTETYYDAPYISGETPNIIGEQLSFFKTGFRYGGSGYPNNSYMRSYMYVYTTEIYYDSYYGYGAAILYGGGYAPTLDRSPRGNAAAIRPVKEN